MPSFTGSHNMHSHAMAKGHTRFPSFLGDIHHLTYVICLFPNPNILHNPTPLPTSTCLSMRWFVVENKAFVAICIIHMATPQAMCYTLVENIMTYIFNEGCTPNVKEINPNDNISFSEFSIVGEELLTLLGCVFHHGHLVLLGPNA